MMKSNRQVIPSWIDVGLRISALVPLGLFLTSCAWSTANDIGEGRGPVVKEALLAGLADPETWGLYGGNYANHRHSPIDDITPQNVAELRVAWILPTDTGKPFEVSPTIYDGVMYVTTSFNRLFALDAETGEVLWRYDHPLPKREHLRLCCGGANRGAAIGGDAVLMATVDAKLVALHRLTGELLWQRTLAQSSDGYSATSMPMVVKDLAVIGVGGGEFGIRGFIDAYDVATGKRRWRHHTVPAAGESGAETWAGDSWKTGGAAPWASGGYDPQTDIMYWATGNPSPDWNGDSRTGDNLYSSSLLAMNPNTGERLWHFQFVPHDLWDYGGNTQLFLVDVIHDGRTVPAIVQAGRNGFFYTLDRASGDFLGATQYVEELNWAHLDDAGRPVVNPKAQPREAPDYRVCPGNLGGMNGASTGAFNPTLRLAYVPVLDACELFQKSPTPYIKGQPFMGGKTIRIDVMEGKAHGHLTAIDVDTGEVRWRYTDPHRMKSGVLSLASGVVFTGNQAGDALALDAASGEVLWRFDMGNGMRSQPVAYRAGGKSHIAIGTNFATSAAFAGEHTPASEGATLFVFALPSQP